MHESILEMIERHGSLGYEQLAAHLREAPDAIRTTLAGMRDLGLVDVLAVGKLVENRTDAASHWRLTAAGSTELARLRSC